MDTVLHGVEGMWVEIQSIMRWKACGWGYRLSWGRRHDGWGYSLSRGGRHVGGDTVCHGVEDIVGGDIVYHGVEGMMGSGAGQSHCTCNQEVG